MLRAVGRGRAESVATISIVEAKRQAGDDFAEDFLKNNTVLVIKCSGNIHTSEIIFHLSKGDFAAGFLKNNTVLVINCFGNIHTSEIIFHFNCDIMVSDRAGKYFLNWKLQGEIEFQIFQVAVIAVP